MPVRSAWWSGRINGDLVELLSVTTASAAMGCTPDLRQFGAVQSICRQRYGSAMDRSDELFIMGAAAIEERY